MNIKKITKLPLGIALILLLIMILGVTVGFKSDEISHGNNILSGGYVTKAGKWIYYKNFSKNGVLYKMKEDGSSRIKLTNNVASYINVVDEWIYYVSSNGIYKVKVDGTKNTKIRDFKDDNKYKTNTVFNDLSSYKNEFYNLYAVGNKLYFIDYTMAPMDDGYKILVSIDIDGKNEKLHNTGTNIEGFIVQQDFMYYWGSFHLGGLYKMKLDDSNKKNLTKLFITKVSVLKNQFYFVTSDFDNIDVNGQLFKTTDEFSSKKMLKIPSKIACMNATSENIYYSTLDNPKTLYKANLDGSNIIKISTFNNQISNIIFDGQWVYVLSKSTMYRVKPNKQDIKLLN